MAYYIKTKSGMKGPFTVAMLRTYVERGRLPPGLTIYAGKTHEPIRVSAVLEQENETPPKTSRPSLQEQTPPSRVSRSASSHPKQKEKQPRAPLARNSPQLQAGSRPIRGSPKGPPRRRPSRSVSRSDGQRWRRYWKTWGALLGFIAIIVVVAAFMWRQDINLREYARQRILATGFGDERDQLLLVLADLEHNRARNLATPTDLRGRSQLVVRKEEFFTVLQRLINQHLAGLQAGPPAEASALIGYWERVYGETRTVVRLKDDGTYKQAYYHLSDRDYTDAGQITGGTYEFDGEGITWHYDGKTDPNPIVRSGLRAFFLKEMDGRFTYWQRRSESNGFRKHLE